MHIQEPKKFGANKMVATRAKKFESHQNHNVFTARIFPSVFSAPLPA
jgi:hypothetical protein